MIYSDDVDSWKKYDGEWVDGLESGFGNLNLKMVTRMKVNLKTLHLMEMVNTSGLPGIIMKVIFKWKQAWIWQVYKFRRLEL